MAEEHTWESLVEDSAQSAALLQELMECKKSSAELADAVREKAKIRKALREGVEVEMENLQKARENTKRRFLLFLGLLQLVFFILVLLKRDILYEVLPAEQATAAGSRPPKPAVF